MNPRETYGALLDRPERTYVVTRTDGTTDTVTAQTSLSAACAAFRNTPDGAVTLWPLALDVVEVTDATTGDRIAAVSEDRADGPGTPPVVWGEHCEHCDRYRRPCGRHETTRPLT